MTPAPVGSFDLRRWYDTRLYHSDIGIPAEIAQPVAGAALTYSLHAHQEARADGVAEILPNVLPEAHTVVEVLTTVDHTPLQWVVRCPINRVRDLVLVVTSGYLVKTVWMNRSDDHHATLNVRRYDRP